MGKFNELLETAGNFVKDNPGLVVGGLGGAALGAGAGYGLTSGNDNDSPSQKLKKRLRAAVYGGLLGGVTGTGAGVFFDKDNENSLVSKISEALTGGSETEVGSPLFWNGVIGASSYGLGSAAQSAYDHFSWGKQKVQNNINKDLIDRVDQLVYNAKQRMGKYGTGTAEYRSAESRANALTETLARLTEKGKLNSVPTKGLTAATKRGKYIKWGTALAAALGLDNWFL